VPNIQHRIPAGIFSNIIFGKVGCKLATNRPTWSIRFWILFGRWRWPWP